MTPNNTFVFVRPSFTSELAYYLRGRKISRNVTLLDISIAAGIDLERLTDIHAGRRPIPTVTLLAKLCAAYDASAQILMGYSKAPKQSELRFTRHKDFEVAHATFLRELGRVIFSARHSRGIDRTTLASAFGVKPSDIERLEIGQSRILNDLKTLHLMGIVLEVRFAITFE